MKDLMPSNPDDSPVSRELKEVFHIDSSREVHAEQLIECVAVSSAISNDYEFLMSSSP